MSGQFAPCCTWPRVLPLSPTSKEKRETITLYARAQQRLAVLNPSLLAGELSSAEAAAYLRLSIRQLRRLMRA
jgi:hypothetical protein